MPIKTGSNLAHAWINEWLFYFHYYYFFSTSFPCRLHYGVVFCCSFPLECWPRLDHFCAMDTSKTEVEMENCQSQECTNQTNISILCAKICCASCTFNKIWKFMDFNRMENSHLHCVHSDFVYIHKQIYVARVSLHSNRDSSNMKSLNIIIIRNKIILNSKSSIVIKVWMSTVCLNVDYSSIEIPSPSLELKVNPDEMERKTLNIVISVRVSAWKRELLNYIAHTHIFEYIHRRKIKTKSNKHFIWYIMEIATQLFVPSSIRCLWYYRMRWLWLIKPSIERERNRKVNKMHSE